MEVFNKVTDILSELSGIEFICPDQNLQLDLGFDSLRMITLLIMLEDNFHIALDESDMNPFDLVSVHSVVKLVKKYIGGEINEKEG